VPSFVVIFAFGYWCVAIGCYFELLESYPSLNMV